MKGLIRRIACALFQVLSDKPTTPLEPEPVSNYELISRDDFLAICEKAHIYPISLQTPLDSKLSIVHKSQLDRLAPWLTFSASLYVADIVDCEDYGIEAQSKAAFKYHVSGKRLALGDMPLGYHGFAMTIDRNRAIWLLEPNAGFEFAGQWVKLGENGYGPDKVFV